MPGVARVETLRWEGGREGVVVLVDQTLLPDSFEEISIETSEAMVEAIRRLSVRGAPAIGVAAA